MLLPLNASNISVQKLLCSGTKNASEIVISFTCNADGFQILHGFVAVDCLASWKGWDILDKARKVFRGQIL